MPGKSPRLTIPYVDAAIEILDLEVKNPRIPNAEGNEKESYFLSTMMQMP